MNLRFEYERLTRTKVTFSHYELDKAIIEVARRETSGPKGGAWHVEWGDEDDPNEITAVAICETQEPEPSPPAEPAEPGGRVYGDWPELEGKSGRKTT